MNFSNRSRKSASTSRKGSDRLGIHQRIEHDRAEAAFNGCIANLQCAITGLFRGVDERHAVIAKTGFRKLRKKTVAKGLGRDACSVGDEEYGAGLSH